MLNTYLTCSFTPTGIAIEIMGLGPNLARKTFGFWKCHKVVWVRHFIDPFLEIVFYTWFNTYILPSVLWHCWLGIRKSIQPVKTEWWGTGVVICPEWGANDLHMVLLVPLTSRHLVSLKSRTVLTFWCWLTLVFLEKEAFTGCHAHMVTVHARPSCLACSRWSPKYSTKSWLCPLIYRSFTQPQISYAAEISNTRFKPWVITANKTGAKYVFISRMGPMQMFSIIYTSMANIYHALVMADRIGSCFRNRWVWGIEGHFKSAFK